MSQQRKFQNTASAIYTAEEMPLASSYEERPLRIPTFSADVFGVVFLLFVFSGAVGWAAFSNWRAGIVVGGLAAVAGIIWRTHGVYDKPLAHIQEKNFQQVEEDTDEATRYANRNTINGSEPIALTRRNKVVQWGDKVFTFSGKQLDKMWDWQKAGDNFVRRDTGTAGNGLRDIGINADYGTAVEVLQGRGLITEKNEWTAAGIAWLSQE